MNTNLQNISSFIASIKSKELSGNSSSRLVSLAASLEGINYQTLLANAQSTGAKFLFWAKPSDQFFAFGFDSLLQFENSGVSNYQEQISLLDKLKNNFENNWDEFELETVPIVMGARKFQEEEVNDVWEDFSNSDWFIPKILFLSTNNKHFLILNYFYENHPDIDSLQDDILSLLREATAAKKDFKVISNDINGDYYKKWMRTIDAALSDITIGKLNKIVLSREVIAKFSATPDLQFLIEKLKNRYPECYTFAFRSGDSIFFGASPEKLINVTKNHFESDALAGSIKRGISSSEDEELARSLLISKKNIAEQKAVVDFIVKAVSKFSDPVVYDKSPRIKKLDNIQHLYTPISGKLKENVSMFEVIDALHPTPAVCGVPCKEAIEFINRNEDHHRGLYSGVIGWFNFNNEAEFAVGIRSALLKGNKLFAYSGCGIVDGSDAESEYEESVLKLKPILTLFENESNS